MLEFLDKLVYKLIKIFKKITKYYYIFIVLFCLILVTFSLQETGYINRAPSYISASIAKLNYPINYLILRAKELQKSLRRYSELEYKYLSLKHKSYLLEKRVLELEQAAIDNKKLRQLLNFIEPKEFKYTSARLYALTNHGYFDTAIIGGGENKSIKPNNIVVSFNGVIGRVNKVFKESAEIILVSDFRSRIPVITETSRQRGILFGSGVDKLKLKHIKNKHNLQIGELLLTSGDGMHFPKGLPVARINNITNNCVEANSFLHLNSLEFVSIILE